MLRDKKRLIFGCALLCLPLTAHAGLLTSESFSLPYGPGNAAAAPYMDEVINYTAGSRLLAWGDKGADGVEGASSIFPSGNSYINNPASIVTYKFNIGSTIDTLNSQYGPGNWTIANPVLTMQYTYYANNSIFGAGAGNFETYWVANNNWSFSNVSGGSNPYGANGYVAGTDPAFALDPTTLLAWAGSESDLGSTSYNWLSPPATSPLAGASAFNPNYSSWSTDKTGLNQGLLTDDLSATSSFVSALTGASQAGGNPNVSLYLMPTSSTLGLTIFTGGGNSTPTLTFNVESVPEPIGLSLTSFVGLGLLRRRRTHAPSGR